MKKKELQTRIKKMEKTGLLTILISVTLVLTLVNLYGTFNLYGKFDSTTEEIVAEPETQPAPTITQPQQPSRVQVSVDDDAFKGSEDAPVTIVEFSDYQCPFCRSFYTQTLSQIQREYIDTGKVKFVYRDFPLSFHPSAQKSAEAAECAEEQGKFWEMHDAIFEGQEKLGQGTVQFTVDDIKQWASDLGLDTTKFNDCLDSGKYASEVQNDFRDGQSYGVRGTPAFYINGISVTGAQPYSAFRQIIEQELNQ